MRALLNSFRGMASSAEMERWADDWLRSQLKYMISSEGMEEEAARRIIDVIHESVKHSIKEIASCDTSIAQRTTCRRHIFDYLEQCTESNVIIKPENEQFSSSWTIAFLIFKNIENSDYPSGLLLIHGLKYGWAAACLTHIHNKRFAKGSPISKGDVECFKIICEYGVEAILRALDASSIRVRGGVPLSEAAADAQSPEILRIKALLIDIIDQASTKPVSTLLPKARDLAVLVEISDERQAELYKRLSGKS